jgi:serine phosphatase RsbU (regulator of sigma subunit)
VNGQELVTTNGLPLGISSEVEYSETHHTLAPEDTLMLISDGVVEAETSSGTSMASTACKKCFPSTPAPKPWPALPSSLGRRTTSR